MPVPPSGSTARRPSSPASTSSDSCKKTIFHISQGIYDVCTAERKPGAETLKPGLDVVGRL